MNGSVEMMEDYRKRSVRVEKAAGFKEEQLKNRIVVGELVDIEKPEMVEEINRIRAKAMRRPS
jgi:2-oxoglutarate ferredoxin oxidoreductase subunit beta